MKNFYLFKLGKPQSILNTSSHVHPDKQTQGREKDNKYFNAWIVLPTACFWRCFGFIS